MTQEVYDIVNFLFLLFYVIFLQERYVSSILSFFPSTYFYLRLTEVPRFRVLSVRWVLLNQNQHSYQSVSLDNNKFFKN